MPEKTQDDNWIVTIQHCYLVPRTHPDYTANRYETFGPYSSDAADKVADRMVEKGYNVLVHQLELWPK